MYARGISVRTNHGNRRSSQRLKNYYVFNYDESHVTAIFHRVSSQRNGAIKVYLKIYRALCAARTRAFPCAIVSRNAAQNCTDGRFA